MPHNHCSHGSAPVDGVPCGSLISTTYRMYSIVVGDFFVAIQLCKPCKHRKHLELAVVGSLVNKYPRVVTP